MVRDGKDRQAGMNCWETGWFVRLVGYDQARRGMSAGRAGLGVDGRPGLGRGDKVRLVGLVRAGRQWAVWVWPVELVRLGETRPGEDGGVGLVRYEP